VKHLLIILSILFLSSPVIGNNHKGETLYRWGKYNDPVHVWKGFGDKETHPIYQGDVENGKPNGLGIIFFPVDGSKYVGGWKDGKKHGQGTSTFSSGNKYVGEWKNGEYHGQGSFTFTNGVKIVGEWKNSKFWNGRYYDKNGKITGNYVNGKRIDQ